MEGVLYFPYIEVPKSAWLTRTVLYWDQVGTIVPDNVGRDPDRWSTYMRELVRSDLLRQVDPAEADTFLLMSRLEEYLGGLSDEELESRQVSCELDEVEPIAYSKFVDMAGLERLRDLGLAKTEGDGFDHRWILVERRTAAEFMAALAISLCQADLWWQANRDGNPMRWVPTTDIPMAATALVAGASRHESDQLFLRVQGHQQTDRIRVDLLERLLPVPVDPVPVEQLERFRRKRGDLLPRLRRFLEEQVDASAAIEDPAMRQRHVDRLADELEERSEQARRYLQESFQRAIGGSKLLRWAKFLPGVGRAADAARDVAESMVTDDEIRSEPLAYLAFANLEFGPATPPYALDWQTGRPLGEPVDEEEA